MFSFFSKKVNKEDLEQLKQAVQTGFNSAKQDVNNLGTWVKHLDSKDNRLKDEIFEVNESLSTLREEVENLKNIISVLGEGAAFKQRQTVFNKQTAFKVDLNTVQTDVQTVFLDKLSITERAIVFVLLNSDIKLSYADLAAMLGKSRATIRGQINSIKQKSENLIEEIVTENNKKRVFITEQIKEILLKRGKVKVKGGSKKNDEYS